MSQQPPNPSINPEIIDTVAYDLPCPNCKYNLRGQNIFVEPHTKLTVIRCSECGQFNPVQTGLKASVSNLAKSLLPILGILWLLFLLCLYFSSLIAEILATLMLLAMYQQGAPTRLLIPIAALFLASPLLISALLSAASTSQKARTAIDRALLKTALYAIGLIAWACLSPSLLRDTTRFQDAWIDHALFLLAAIALHALLSFHGALFGRPIAISLCTTLLPKSIHPAILKYWNLTPSPSHTS